MKQGVRVFDNQTGTITCYLLSPKEKTENKPDIEKAKTDCCEAWFSWRK